MRLISRVFEHVEGQSEAIGEREKETEMEINMLD